jgi:hypothetical protein
MPRASVARQASALSMQGPWHPADLLPQLQSTMAALADIEVRYQSDQTQLQGWTGPRPSRRSSRPSLQSATSGSVVPMFRG